MAGKKTTRIYEAQCSPSTELGTPCALWPGPVPDPGSESQIPSPGSQCASGRVARLSALLIMAWRQAPAGVGGRNSAFPLSIVDFQRSSPAPV